MKTTAENSEKIERAITLFNSILSLNKDSNIYAWNLKLEDCEKELNLVSNFCGVSKEIIIKIAQID